MDIFWQYKRPELATFLVPVYLELRISYTLVGKALSNKMFICIKFVWQFSQTKKFVGFLFSERPVINEIIKA